MSPILPLWMCLDEMADRLASSRRLLVASDFDGTLTPIVERPSAARLPARARAAMRALTRLPNVHVAVLSGRRLADLRPYVGLPGVFLAGCAGFETEDERGRRRDHVPSGREIPEAVRDVLADCAARVPGALLEDKRLTLAFHYRGVPAARQAAVRASVVRRLAPFRRRIRLVPGKRVIDVQPNVAWDKASALALWDARHRGAPVFFFGDDEVDEPVFEALAHREGVPVVVGASRSLARYRVRDAAEVVWFLEWLAREWRERMRSRRAKRRGESPSTPSAP